MSDLDSAIRGWRKTKHPRFAVLAELATARVLATTPRDALPVSAKASDLTQWNDTFAADDPLDVPRLFTALAAGRNSVIAVERLRLLAQRSDPRIVSGVLALLESPPFRSRTAMPFFRICIELLGNAEDPRVKPALESFSMRFRGIIETSVGSDVSSLLRSAATSMTALSPDTSMASTAVELEKNYLDELAARERAVASSVDSHKNDDALLEAIISAPGDDTPRLIYADALAERSEPRAELIALQIARAHGAVSDANYRREVELLADKKRLATWALPLSQAGECTFARGFPDELILDSKNTSSVVGAPLLRVLRSVTGFERRIPVGAAKALLNGPELRGAQHIGGLIVSQLEALEDDAPWPSVRLAPLQRGVPYRTLRRVKRLAVDWSGDAPQAPPFAVLEQLEHLALHVAEDPARFIDGLTSLVSLDLSSRERLSDLSVLRGLTHLKVLDVSSDSIDERALDGLGLEALTLRQGDPRALLAALPFLQSLTLEGFKALQQVASYMKASRRDVKHMVFGPLALDLPFTPEGVARVTSSFELGEGKTRDLLLDAVALLTGDCVQRIEITPRSHDPHHPINEPTMRLLEGLCRMHAQVPVVLRWQ